MRLGLSLLSSCRAWHLHSYRRGIQGLTLQPTAQPSLNHSHGVLVRVLAASVNPIDVWMASGYGWSLFSTIRGCQGVADLPIVLGRDFSGVVVDKGLGCSSQLKVGDEVWGSTFPARDGTHSEYVTALEHEVSKKPSNLSHIEAAAVPYAGLTGLSALSITGEMLTASSRRGKRVLVIGASGGVGHLAVQILKSWGSHVVTVCGESSHELVTKLGADVCIDYTDPQYRARVAVEGGKGYDLVLDCSGHDDPRWQQVLRPWSGAKYVTLTSPLLKEQNTRGLAFGTVSSLVSLVEKNVQSYTSKGTTHRWAYFMPVPNGLEQLGRMAENDQIRPLVNSVFPFEKANDAYAKVESGHLRGKVVIDMTSKD